MERSIVDIRAEIERLQAEIKVDEEGNLAAGQGAHERIGALASELAARNAACFYCAFGTWPKSEHCKHE
jgi:uncharacterized small protein (DUF1192 family)